MKKLTQINSSSNESTEEWRARKGTHSDIVLGKDKVESLLAHWQPFNSLYVAPPGYKNFVNAIDIEEIKEHLYSSYVFRSRLSIFILTIIAIAIAFIGNLKGKTEITHLSFALALLVIFMTADHLISTRTPETLMERSRFYLFAKKNGRLDVIILSVIMLFTGILQLIAEKRLGDFEALIVRYGALYKAIESGEWWRLITGPFLHVGFLHWLTNLFSLALIIGLAGTISRRLTLLVFLFSSSTGAYAGWIFSGLTHQDAYAGISGGIFGVYGMCISFTFYCAKEFPEKMWLIISGFSILNIFISAAINANSSIEGHFAGLLAGFILSSIVSHIPKFKSLPTQSSHAPDATRSAHAPAADSPH